MAAQLGTDTTVIFLVVVVSIGSAACDASGSAWTGKESGGVAARQV